ncbi:MAG: hypothetical protein SGJ27_18970 [Candidatus Melainabacteria bacterium]|nr:hypothetical protein [Candidatus Melainabacteria bacterium]
MSAGKVMFAVFALGLAIVFGASALDNLNDDTVYNLRELAGIGILSFVFIGCVSVMTIFGLSDAVCAFMEGRGDQLMHDGDVRGARRWYDRCLWLQDHLLNNLWRRTRIAGKHVATYRANPEAENANDEVHLDPPPGYCPTHVHTPMDPNQNLEDDSEPDDGSASRKWSVPPAVANSLFYKYVFGIVFTLVAIVHALDGTMIGAMGILFVGIGLNAYWLATSKDQNP